MVWNPEYETMSRQKLRELQLSRLKATIKWSYENVPFYKRKFGDAGISPKNIRTLDDISKLPFTTKNDLRDNYPYNLFAVPMDQIVRIHSSSGTTGKPIVVGYTKGDLNTWAECVARIAVAAGVTSKDIVQIAFGYGLFTGGFGLHYGLERMGASVIPASAGNTERQIMIMKDFGSTALVSTPSYALYISEIGKEMGIDFNKIPLKIGLFGGEPMGDKLRDEIEKNLSIFATDNYGLSEVIGPGVSGECQERDGLHVAEDHFMVEVIDKNEKPLSYGEEGELVFTSLTKEAFPIIRYRTRDISRLKEEQCPCGRTTVRMENVRARTDDMLIIRGVNVFPSQIESVLLETEGTRPHFQIIIDKEGPLDVIEVLVEISEDMFPDVVKGLVALEKTIHDKLYSILGIHAKIRLVEPKTIERTTGKAKKVIDRRKK